MHSTFLRAKERITIQPYNFNPSIHSYLPGNISFIKAKPVFKYCQSIHLPVYSVYGENQQSHRFNLSVTWKPCSFAPINIIWIYRMKHQNLLVLLITIFSVITISCSNDEEDEDLMGKWYRVSDFDGLARGEATSFTIGNKISNRWIWRQKTS